MTLISLHPSEPCMRGHRSTKCMHSDRILVQVRKPGRPLSSCPHSEGRCDCTGLRMAIPKGDFRPRETGAHIVSVTLMDRCQHRDVRASPGIRPRQRPRWTIRRRIQSSGLMPWSKALAEARPRPSYPLPHVQPLIEFGRTADDGRVARPRPPSRLSTT